MKKLYFSFLVIVLYSVSAQAQFVQDVVNAIRQDSLERKVSELSGETSSLINGVSSTITTRIQSNNDLAAEYIKDHFEALDGLIINDQTFNAGAGIGRNIIAAQIGTVNPDKIYLICAHYDSVAAFCADDNATGTASVLEIARILSQYETENTIVYALWDQEENGLRGSNFYAEQASTDGDDIVAVINMDMMGYQNQTVSDNNFDIDLNSSTASIAIKDDLLALQPTYAPDLNPLVVQPGTPFSDHKPFWDEGFGAVLVGESWETSDQTPFYHMSSDKLATLDLDYYHDMVKLVGSYTATKAGIVRLLSNSEFEKDTFKIFPNPVTSVLNIESTISETLDLEFYDINGKIVKKEKLENQNHSIDVSNFSQGVFFVKISSALAKSTFKFVKE